VNTDAYGHNPQPPSKTIPYSTYPFGHKNLHNAYVADDVWFAGLVISHPHLFTSIRVFENMTSWTVRGSNPGGGEIFCTCPAGPGAHPASCTMGTRSFPGVECGRGVTLTPHPILEPRSKNRVQLYLYSP
jgi:hypothetical protein